MEWNLREWYKKSKNHNENMTRAYYYTKISRLAMNQFVYESDDDILNMELIEKYLWLDGRVAIWYNDYLGWVVTRVNETGWDINGLANRWKPVYDMQPSYIPQPEEMGIDDDIVVIYDLPNRMFTSNICAHWIDEIADINETIKSQIFCQKTPLIAMAGNPKQKQKLKDMIVEIGRNVKALFVDSSVQVGTDIQAMTIDAPFNISDLQAHLKTKEAEMLEFLGIDSQSSFQKKERLITDEQESNNQTLSYLIADRYLSRQKGCEKLKEKGLTLNVSIQQTTDPNKSEGNINDVNQTNAYQTD